MSNYLQHLNQFINIRQGGICNWQCTFDCLQNNPKKLTTDFDEIFREMSTMTQGRDNQILVMIQILIVLIQEFLRYFLSLHS